MKIFSTIKTKSRALASLILGGVLFAQVFAFAGSAQAASPQFNFLSGDWELLRGANRTTNQTDWTDPVSGSAGDTFAGIIYYHNGYVDTTANNVVVKVNIPSQTTNNTATISASISADNAATVTDTVVNGVLQGKSGLTINLDQAATLSLVSGSVKWFPNYSGSSSTSQDLPNGQTGDSIGSTGVNIGNINGCWNYIGYVTFLVKTEKTAQPSVSVAKTVRNVTLGETSFVETNYAKPGDTLEYSVTVTNSGSGTAENLYLVDAIPSGTTYVSGSSTKSVNGGSFATVADGITGDGLSIGSLASGETAEVRFRVTVGQGVTNGSTLTNTVSLYINKEVKTDTAKTIVKFGVSTPVVDGTLPVTGGDNVILFSLASLSAGLYLVYRKYKMALLALKR